jgi:hypothetical protein
MGQFTIPQSGVGLVTMKTTTHARLPWIFMVAMVLAGAMPERSHASTILLNGTGTMSYTYQYVNSSPSNPTVSNDYALAVAGQYTFLDSFTSEQTGTSLGTTSVGAYDFQDSYRFTINAGASGDTMVASLGLGDTFDINDLQFRLYEVATPTTAPQIGGIPSGSNLITGWMGPPAGSNEVSATFTGIQSGTYILDVAGIASGTSGGTYVGQLNLNPVPLPAALWLLASGLGLLRFAVPRTQRSA